MVSTPPLACDLRADLARRPTMMELFHRGNNPRTLPPEFTTWFDFVAAEGDATALEAECLSRFRDWLVMLATTRMTKSFKMVLLRVLLDNDAVFAGMPIPELAAKCREFLMAHEFLRRDIADAATGQPVEMSPRKWESSWRKFPISIWMQEQEGRNWFTIEGDSLRAAFACDERLRGPLESMSGEVVDFRLAAHARPRASATGFVAKVIHSRGKPLLKLPTVDQEPGRPDGPVLVRLPAASVLADHTSARLRRIHRSCEVNSVTHGLQGAEVAAAMQNSSDLKAVRRGTKKYHVHTDRHTAASCNPESRS